MELSVWNIVKASADLYKKHWRTIVPFLGLLLVASLISAIPTILYGNTWESAQTITDIANQFWTYLPYMLASGVMSGFVGIMFMLHIDALYVGRKTAMLSELATIAGKKFFPALGAGILYMLILFGGMMLFVIPGIIFWLWFVFYTQAIVLDNKKILESLKFSKSLVKGRWWRVFALSIGSILLFIALLVVTQLIVTIVLATIARMLPPFFALQYAMVMGAINQIVSVIVTPLLIIAPIILYVELKKHPVTTVQS